MLTWKVGTVIYHISKFYRVHNTISVVKGTTRAYVFQDFYAKKVVHWDQPEGKHFGAVSTRQYQFSD